MLENGDLIFVKDDSDIGQAIQTSTGNYSHVAIFWTDRSIMQLRKAESLPNLLKISLKMGKSMTFIAMRRLIVQRLKNWQRAF